MHKKQPRINLFLRKVSVLASGCWEWLGARNKNGYGRFYNGEKLAVAHQYSYLYYIGKIPSGLQLDHLCRNKFCVNPIHLEAVTAKENCRRAPNVNLLKTHCPKGHEYDDKNTYRDRKGRKCRECRKLGLRELYARRRCLLVT